MLFYGLLRWIAIGSRIPKQFSLSSGNAVQPKKPARKPHLLNLIEFFTIYRVHCVCSYEKVRYVDYISDPNRDLTMTKTLLESLIQ